MAQKSDAHPHLQNTIEVLCESTQKTQLSNQRGIKIEAADLEIPNFIVTSSTENQLKE